MDSTTTTCNGSILRSPLPSIPLQPLRALEYKLALPDSPAHLPPLTPIPLPSLPTNIHQRTPICLVRLLRPREILRTAVLCEQLVCGDHLGERLWWPGFWCRGCRVGRRLEGRVEDNFGFGDGVEEDVDCLKKEVDDPWDVDDGTNSQAFLERESVESGRDVLWTDRIAVLKNADPFFRERDWRGVFPLAGEIYDEGCLPAFGPRIRGCTKKGYDRKGCVTYVTPGGIRSIERSKRKN